MTDPQTEGAPPSEAPAAPRKSRGHRRPVIKRRVKRKEREEELQTPDEFQERGRPVVDWVLDRWRIIAGAVAASLIILAVVALVGRLQEGRDTDAAGALAEAVRELPDGAGFSADLSDEADEVDKALAAFDVVIKDHEGTLAAHQARVEAGNAAYRAGDFEKAVGYYDAAVDAQGLTGHLARNGAGYALEALERYDDAATRFEASRASAAGNAREQAFVDLGRVYEAKGDTAKATELYAAFEAEFPDSSRLSDIQAKAAALKGAE